MACSTSLPLSAQCATRGNFVVTHGSNSKGSPTLSYLPASLGGSFLGKKIQPVQKNDCARRRAASVVRAALSTESVAEPAPARGSSEPSWLELHGSDNWKELLPIVNAEGLVTRPIHEALKNEIIKYGEMAQLTYDSVNLYPWSRYRDQNRYRDPRTPEHKHESGKGHKKPVQGETEPGVLFGENLKEESHFEQLGTGQNYKAVAYLYVSEDGPVIKNLRKSVNGQDIANDVWIGFIAHSDVKKDIAISWRGTQKPSEWIADAEVALVDYETYKQPDGYQAPVDKNDSPLALLPTPIDKFIYGALAFVGAVGWGGLSAAILGIVLQPVFKVMRSEGLLGVVFAGAFAFCAGLPIGKTFLGKDGSQALDFAKKYAVAVAAFDVVLNLLTPPDYFFISHAVLFALAVLLPTGLTAAQEAYECAGERPQVHEGFFKLYRGAKLTAQGKRDPQLRKSVQRVVHETVREFLEKYPDIETISVTGHSLGAAIAVLCAYDLVASETNVGPKNGKTYPVACFSFEGPRVGNPAFVNSFRDLKAKGLACVRIANKPDIVTEVPKAFYLQNVYYILAAITNNGLVADIIDAVERLGYWLQLPSAWQHVAKEQSLVHDSREVDYLKKMPGWLPWENSPAIGDYHNLEVNLHLVSGYWGGPDAIFDRDFALCNKSADMIDERAGVQPNWFSGKVKGLVQSRVEPGALIEPYADWLEPPSGDDEERKRGEGPAVGPPGEKECKPLVRNYFKKYEVMDNH